MMRSLKFGRYRRYYDGTIYSDSAFRLAHKLYSQTKALVSFLARAVDLDVALVPGVMGPWELAEGATQQTIDAQQQLYRWSSWATEGDDWLEDGATLGEAMLKIVPMPEQRMVKMQRLKPEISLLIDNHVDPQTGERNQLLIICDRGATDGSNETYEYGEVITPAEIRTYRDGEPFGYNGNPDRYPNQLGFVPAICTGCDTDKRPTFSKVLPQLDSVNELASYVADIIGRHIEPQMAAFGVDPNALTKSHEKVWFFPPADARLEPIIAEIDIDGSLAFIESIKGETKANLPELAFDELRAKDQIATETLQVQLIELDAKIWRMRRRFDAALISAHIMAAVALGVYRIADLSALLAPHELDYQRPVRPISRLEQIREEEAELALEAQRSVFEGEGITQSAGVASEIVRA